MGNIISYLRWRGDLLWSEAPFNEVDNLILACLSYFDFDGIVSETEVNPVSLMCAAENFFSEHRESKSPADPDLLKKAAASKRCGDVMLWGYRDIMDRNQEMTQFAALHFVLEDGNEYISFRGTDNTIVGLSGNEERDAVNRIRIGKAFLIILKQLVWYTMNTWRDIIEPSVHCILYVEAIPCSYDGRRDIMIHILIVEDDSELNQFVCSYLNNSGFSAKGCLNVRDAYDEMYNNLYDLIISDIMMPEIDGFEFAKSIRKVNKTIPILFMSAKDDLPSKQKGFQFGIDDYMVKPIEVEELLLRVRALLRRANIEMERKLTAAFFEPSGIGLRQCL